MTISLFYNGDYKEFTNEFMSDSYIDLIVTDPPYLTNYQSNRRVVLKKFNKMENDDNDNFLPEYLEECYRILKEGAGIYVFCNWKRIDYFKQIFEQFFTLKNIIIWVKNNHGSGDLKGSYAPKYEMILFGSKGRHILNSPRIPDVIEVPKIPSKKLLHPTQKPVELLEILIEKSSNPWDKVFDGTAGVGSTLVAAQNLNRVALGAELDYDYFMIGADRLGGEIV